MQKIKECAGCMTHRQRDMEVMKRYARTSISKETRGNPWEPYGSEITDMERSNCEKASPFHSATGAHKECEHLF
jgi:hypothetical protein